MDFWRVKLLLIVVFLCLNVFLAIQWLTLQSSVSVYAEPLSDQLAHAQSVLSLRGVKLAAPIPASPTQMSALLVTYDHSSLVTVGAAVLDVKPAQIVKWQHGPGKIVGPGVSLTLVHPGAFRVLYRPPIFLGRLTAGRAKINASLRDWIAKHDYNGQNYVYLGGAVNKDHAVQQFVQVMNGQPDFSAGISAQLQGGNLQSYEQSGVVQVANEPPRPLMNAVSALLSLADFLDKANLQVDNTIEDIKLGYASLVTSTQEWVITPVWRMRTTRGVFLVNAFSGEVGVEAP